MTQLRISVVSYLNSRPFSVGLQRLAYDGFEITEDLPSVCADKLQNGTADIGLVPVAMLPVLEKAGGNVVTQFCISANGPVRSVMLFSNVPVSSLKAIILDDDSRTSVTLTRLLAKYFWKIEPEWISEKDRFEPDDYTGRVLIGDRALRENGKFKVETDLASEWKKFTGLPFVFACWVAMRPLNGTETANLELAFKNGLALREEISKEEQIHYPETDLRKYLFENIRYELSPDVLKGLEKFREMLNDPRNQSLLPFSRS